MARRLTATALAFATVTLAACGHAHSFAEDRALFQAKRSLFEKLVADIGACKGLRYDRADGPKASQDVCVEDPKSQLPKLIASELKQAGVLWVIVWREPGDDSHLGAPDRLVTIEFVTAQSGLLELGEASASKITYYAAPPRPSDVSLSGHFTDKPLAPPHWYYEKIDDTKR